MLKKILILVAIFVVLMVGFSFFIIQISGYNKVYTDERPEANASVNKAVMKCGTGKCGANMK